MAHTSPVSLELAHRIEFVALHGGAAIDIAEPGQNVRLAHTWNQGRETLLGLVSGLLQPNAKRAANSS